MRDANGRIASVSATAATGSTTTVVTAISYLPFGPASSYSYGSGQVLTKTYDHAYRSTGVISTPLYLQYTLDASGNPVALKDAPNQASPAESYQYDPLYRLQQMDDATGAPWQAYTYNRTGDRLSKTTAGIGTDAYEYQSDTHRLIDITGAEPSARAVDASGNTVAMQVGSWVYGFGYDDSNRLSIAQAGGQHHYVHDGKGARVRKQGVGTTNARNYLYDESGRLLAEYPDINGQKADYVWADDVPVAFVWGHPNGPGQLRYVLTDGLGTPRLAINPGGATVWSWPAEQNPFGERVASGIGYLLNLRFPGQYYDQETGLHYNYFRDYEPATGRYIESDPVGLAGGQNTYIYVRGNPLIAVDEFGLRPYYGKWCGPDWTGGRKEEYNPVHASLYQGPIDNLDTACMHHDICYCRCRKGYPCNSGQRGQCMTQCDRALAMETAVIGRGESGRGAPLYAWMRYNHSPSPGPDSPDCPKCGRN